MKTLACTLTALMAATPALADQIKVALDWTPNTNHIGLYVAEAKGWYDAAGLDVTILPYTDTSSAALVANGVAEWGVFSSLSMFMNRTAGADLVATYAVVQTETGRLVFQGARDDLHSPRDLQGLTYAGFGTDWERALIAAMMRADGVEAPDFTMITLGAGAYEALDSGRVDFTLEVYTWEGVKAEMEGQPHGAFRYADYGVPDQHTTLIGASGAWLQANPDTARAFMAATLRGYEWAADNPDEAAQLLVAGAGGLLPDADLATASMRALVEGGYLRAADGTIGRIDPDKIEAMGSYLFEAGVLKDADGRVPAVAPDFSGYATNDYLP